jgi:hypothetical protein
LSNESSVAKANDRPVVIGGAVWPASMVDELGRTPKRRLLCGSSTALVSVDWGSAGDCAQTRRAQGTMNKAMISAERMTQRQCVRMLKRTAHNQDPCHGNGERRFFICGKIDSCVAM